MAQNAPADVRKRILFFSCLLGFMIGIATYLAVKAVRQPNYALLAILPLLLITGIPLVKTLIELRRHREPVR